jgi:valyl-tRNA synthetase
MAGLEFKGKIPFDDVYFTSILRDGEGRKMSKSLGNSPDPLEVIKQYGADALRFTVTYIAPLGQDVLFSVDKCEIGRNFANKIWNAARFLIMNKSNIELKDDLLNDHLDFTDKWIYSRFQSTLSQYYQALDKFDINGASKIVYAYIWNDFCDWYIELSKNRLYSEDPEVKSAVLTRAVRLFEDMLKILHPFMPFISEEIWQLLSPRQNGDSISISSMPECDKSMIDKSAEGDMEFVESIVYAIRNIRGEMSIPPSKIINILLNIDSVEERQLDYIKSLGKVGEVKIGKNIKKPKLSASAVVKDCDVYIPLEGIIDIDVEKKRLDKEVNRIEGLLKGVNKKLSNKNFVEKAPAEIIEKEKAKETNWRATLDKLINIRSELD